MPRRDTHNFIRVLVGTALFTALLACAIVPTPDDFPAIALGQASLYRLEIALFVFYSGLLLITPAFSGLIDGRLPIEISTRGARFAEGADRSAELDQAAITELEAIIRNLARGLTDAQIEIQQLSERTNRDSRQQEVDSKDD